MRVVLLSAANNVHTVKWANDLAEQGVEIFVVSLHDVTQDFSPDIVVHQLKFTAPFGYLLNILEVRRLLKDIDPDIVNAHYATGYGLLSVVSSGRYRNIISLWGSDIFLFPKKSRIHGWVLKSILSRADAIFSTSECMKRELDDCGYAVNVPVLKTPFGVDTELFNSLARGVIETDKPELVFGTVKSLKSIYGIDILIKAFALLVARKSDIDMQLLIYGEGIELENLKALSEKLGISSKVKFGGYIKNERVPEVLAGFDIYAAFSHSESFGVAVIEASACEVPVVVSDADGFLEVVTHEKTGFIVPRNDVEEASNALLRLAESKGLRQRLGSAGRARAVNEFSKQKCVENMIGCYKQVLDIDSSR
ncbi:glycosyltransferase [Shewanella waksmanii]|uniref:glycosyltransferase n=1 Tax=Shewanella waksmanii TaxID=213783 RepID=UPI00048D8E0B|nr:glycosyltransferase [Shewanella waksmanii]